MSKPTLLYASPFPPQKSGISDYSVILVKALSEKFDITLYTDNYVMEAPSLSGFPLLKHGVDRVDFDKFDYILYNMGNNYTFHQYIYEAALAHPGVIIQHDMVIFHFVYGYYKKIKKNLYSTLYSKFGMDAFTAIKHATEDHDISADLASNLPLNDELLKSGNRFIVHSHYSRNKILETGYITEDKIAKINLIDQMEDDEVFLEKEALYKKFGIDPNAVVVIALGNILNTKKNIETCKVVKDISKTSSKKVCYVMVGSVDYADEYLEDGLIIKTGYTELQEFNSFVKHADIIVNLRYPSLGETSAAMVRSLQLGKPIVTNNGGWFTELPESVVAKIELDKVEKNLKAKLTELIEDDEARKSLGERAHAYACEEYAKSIISQKMFDYITGK